MDKKILLFFLCCSIVVAFLLFFPMSNANMTLSIEEESISSSVLSTPTQKQISIRMQTPSKTQNIKKSQVPDRKYPNLSYDGPKGQDIPVEIVGDDSIETQIPCGGIKGKKTVIFTLKNGKKISIQLPQNIEPNSKIKVYLSKDRTKIRSLRIEKKNEKIYTPKYSDSDLPILSY